MEGGQSVPGSNQKATLAFASLLATFFRLSNSTITKYTQVMDRYVTCGWTVDSGWQLEMTVPPGHGFNWRKLSIYRPCVWRGKNIIEFRKVN